MPKSFKISDAHLQAFSKQQSKRFEDEMCAYFRAEYPEKYKRAGEPWVRELVQTGTEKAKRYDIYLEPDIARFIDVMFAISPNFDENEKTAWARSILDQRRMTPEQRLDAIHERLMFAPQSASESSPPSSVTRPLAGRLK